MNLAPELLTVAEVGRRLGYARGTVYRLIATGDLVAYKGRGRNGRLRISEAVVHEYLEATRKQAAS